MKTVALALIVLGIATAIAVAGGTGGRMGGGSWGSSSSSSSRSSPSSSTWSSSGGWSSSSHSSPSRSSSSSWHSTGSSWSSSSDSYSSHYPSHDDSAGSYSSSSHPWSIDPSFLFFTLGVIVTIGILVVMLWGTFTSDAANATWGDNVGPVPFDQPGRPLGDNQVDVTVLRIAVDGRARKFVQSELARIAKVADTSTDEGRVRMLVEVSAMLRKLRDAWVYGGAHNEPVRALGNAKGVFDGHVDDARSRFQLETISNVQGAKTTAASPGYSPRGDEGLGLILVSIVLAARLELFTVSRIGDGEDLRKALESASHLAPSDLVAIEIIWQPSEDGDRLSSLELVAKYPSPDLIPIQGALVGKAFCTHCSGPFPAELVSCPHCGAPAPGRERQAA